MNEFIQELRNIKSEVYTIAGEISVSRNLDLIVPLTLITFLLFIGSFWYLRLPVGVLCILGLVFKPITKKVYFWFLLTCFMVSCFYRNWYTLDNHQYLMLYWTIALTCLFIIPKQDHEKTLAINGRLLIGACMALAFIWKAGNANYLDGSFFHFTLMTDSRFENFSHLFGGIEKSDLVSNREMIKDLKSGYLTGVASERSAMMTNQHLILLAHFLTWWTLIIEGLIAVLFFLPERKIILRFRNWALLIFGFTTYSVATVTGFAWQLMILGIAQCRPEQKSFRLGYFLVFLLMQLYMAPVYDLVSSLLSLIGL